MANHHGKEGIVKIGANTVAEVRNWEIEETGDQAEDTSMGDTARTYVAGLTGWTGRLACWWDETDTTGQGSLTINASVTLDVNPEGAASGDTHYSGTAFVSRILRRAAHDGIVEAEFEFQGTGTLTEANIV